MPADIRREIGLAGGIVGLLEQHLLIVAVPAPAPVLVRPVQAEADVDRRIGQKVLHRPFQQTPAIEVVVVEAEGSHAGMAGGLGLLVQHPCSIRKVVVTVIAGNAGLVMPLETRYAARDIAPFGEPRSPPAIVLVDRMELRQVEGHQIRHDSGRRLRRQTSLELGTRPLIGRQRLEERGARGGLLQETHLPPPLTLQDPALLEPLVVGLSEIGNDLFHGIRDGHRSSHPETGPWRHIAPPGAPARHACRTRSLAHPRTRRCDPRAARC